MNKKFQKYCNKNNIETLHKMSYHNISSCIKSNPIIIEELFKDGHWRILQYLLSICSITIKELEQTQKINFFNCFVSIFSDGDMEDKASYIAIMRMYKLFSDQELYHYLYMYLDRVDPEFDIRELFYETDMDIIQLDAFTEYCNMMEGLREKVFLKLFANRKYEKGLIGMILKY